MKNTASQEERRAYYRECSRKYYHKSNGKQYHKLRYLIRKNNISEEELEGFDDFEQKLLYCQTVHIKNKYGITISDIDDTTTVATEIPDITSV